MNLSVTLLETLYLNKAHVVTLLCENRPVSPRRNYPKNRIKPEEPREINIKSTGESTEEHKDGTYIVRRLTGSGSSKPYRCPGCDQLIPLATPHIVAWLEYDEEGRRHWHNACWSKKDKRQPNTERTRNAPRF
jgi:hypothetical protein